PHQSATFQVPLEQVPPRQRNPLAIHCCLNEHGIIVDMNSVARFTRLDAYALKPFGPLEPIRLRILQLEQRSAEKVLGLLEAAGGLQIIRATYREHFLAEQRRRPHVRRWCWTVQ